MNLEQYEVAGASANPIDLSLIPIEPLELQVPVRTDNAQSLRRKSVVWMIVMSSVAVVTLALLVTAASSSRANVYWLLVAAFVFFQFSQNASLRNPLNGRLLFLRQAILTGTCVLGLVYLLQRSGQMAYLPSVCGCLLVWQALSFRRHVIRRATTGMLDANTISRFRTWKRLPKGLSARSRMAGFIDLLGCYLTYNRDRKNAPGLFRSPAGSQRIRAIASCILLCLLAALWFVATIPLMKQLESDGLIAHANSAIALNLVLSPIVAFLIWTGTLFMLTFRFIGRASALKQKQISPSHWRRMLDRLENSQNTIERESLWLGWVQSDGSPILYPLDQLFKHAWIVGKTGSGKSAWIMGVILDQIIYRSDIQVVVLDLKATSFEMFSAMKSAVAAKARKSGTQDSLKYFTLQEGEQTFLFDIFSQVFWQQLATPQRCSVILSALALAYSQAYGQSFYRDSAYDFLAFVLDRNPDVKSWKELLAKMQDAIRWAKEPHELSKRCKEDAEHLVFVVRRLASFTALNHDSNLPAHVLDEAIDFSGGHYYFALSATENSFIAGEVGRLVAASILASARHSGTQRTVLVIDEWQEMCTRDLELLLSQARGLGVGVVLANQNAAQLVTKDMDMRPIVEGNTSLQAWMSVTDAVGREQLRRLGGQEIAILASQRLQPGKETSVTFSQSLQDRVSGNLVSAITSDTRQFLIRITDNVGYACYGDLLFAARNMFHQPKRMYDAACQMSWPAPTPSTMTNKNSIPKRRSAANRSSTVAPPKPKKPSKRLGPSSP